MLLEEADIVGIAVDTISLDCGQSKNFATHKTVLSAGKWGNRERRKSLVRLGQGRDDCGRRACDQGRDGGPAPRLCTDMTMELQSAAVLAIDYFPVGLRSRVSTI